jgi:hypothetical protein
VRNDIHANARSGVEIYDEAGAEGGIIGVYSGVALEGISGPLVVSMIKKRPDADDDHRVAPLRPA